MLWTIPAVGSMTGYRRVSGAGSTVNLDNTAANPAMDCIKPRRSPEIKIIRIMNTLKNVNNIVGRLIYY